MMCVAAEQWRLHHPCQQLLASEPLVVIWAEYRDDSATLQQVMLLQSNTGIYNYFITAKVIHDIVYVHVGASMPYFYFY